MSRLSIRYSTLLSRPGETITVDQRVEIEL
jgi:hypothetical protein